MADHDPHESPEAWRARFTRSWAQQQQQQLQPQNAALLAALGPSAPTDIASEAVLDEDRDDPELQLARTPSHSEDPDNTGGVELQASHANAAPLSLQQLPHGESDDADDLFADDYQDDATLISPQLLPHGESDDVFVDNYRDDPELQLARTPSQSEDPVNTGGPEQQASHANAAPLSCELESDDEDRDDPELQPLLARTTSHSEDSGNTGGAPVSPELEPDDEADDEADDVFVDNYHDDYERRTRTAIFGGYFASLTSHVPPTQPVRRPFISSDSELEVDTFISSDSDLEVDRPSGENTRGSVRYDSNIMAATSPARGGVSPSSSPRLPSPPPFTEVQIGPKSPSVGHANQNPLADAARIDNGSTRRIRPGTKAADMEKGPPLVPLNEVDSPFQAQEYLLALYKSFTHDPKTSFSNPITRDTALKLATPPQIHGPESSSSFDRNLWLYELCRFLMIRANDIIVALFADKPPCTASSCPEMRASEWQYLCAVHDPPKPCCAIDYCCHTLDWAGNLLSSPKYFPSRLTLGEGGNTAASIRHLTNIFRRVYRIFAHAWFQHRGVFWEVEGRNGIYIFFKTVCDVYQLIPEDNYTIPADAEGGNADEHWETKTPVNSTNADAARHKMQILTKDNIGVPEDSASQIHSPGKQQQHEQEGETTTTVSVGATTRRHKHTPSTGSQVTMIPEGMEEEDGGVDQLRNVEDEDEDLGANQGAQPSGPSGNEDIKSHQKSGLLSEGSLGAHGLGRLDLSADSLAEMRAPEDPTPLASHVGDPMASLVTASASAMYGYGEEGKQDIEDKMAGLSVEEAEGDVDEKAEGEAEADTEKNEDGVDLEKLSKSVVQDSQESNLGEAERDKKVDESATMAPSA